MAKKKKTKENVNYVNKANLCSNCIDNCKNESKSKSDEFNYTYCLDTFLVTSYIKNEEIIEEKT
jgi:hypothetical protein